MFANRPFRDALVTGLALGVVLTGITLMSTLYLQAAIAFWHVPPTGTASMAADGEDQDSIDTDQVPAVSAATL